MKKFTAATLAAAVIAAGFSITAFAEPDKKASIKEVMKAHFKGDTSDIRKASKGELTSEQLASLVSAAKSLPDGKPANGDDASWKEKSNALVAALEKLEKGEAGAAEAVKAAANCKACHDVHKGK
jgi:hypothetical protein